MAWSGISHYEITLEKQVYFPGQIVRGTMNLTTTGAISCRGIRLQLSGKGFSHIIRGSGKDRKDYYHTHMYANSKRTIWGQLIKTPCLDDCGENAIFGPPWAPDEGVLTVPLQAGESQIIVRAMDYAWLQKDSVLGEIVLDINLHMDRGVLEFPLTRNGHHEKGKIVLQMTWEPDTSALMSFSGSRAARITVLRATGLRSAEWFGKNDVYIQAYTCPPGKAIMTNAALPEPLETSVLPPGRYAVPFAMQLPNDLPSSFTGINTYVAYSIYSHIDIAWKADPSTRSYFTVVQPHVVASMMSPQRALQTSTVYPQCCIPPLCCFSVPVICAGAYGDVNFTMSTDRRAYAPGERIRLTTRLDSTWADAPQHIVQIQVVLMMKYLKWCRGGETETITQDLCLEDIRMESLGVDQLTELRVPSTPPTYHGGIDYSAWYQSVNGYGLRWGTVIRDPVVWSYEVIVRLEMKVPGITCFNKVYSACIPVVIGAIGLAVQPPFEDTAYWEAQELAAASRVGTGSNAHGFGGQAPLPWQTVTNVQASLDRLSQYEPVKSGPAVQLVHEEEDINTPAAQTMFAPAYYVFPDAPVVAHSTVPPPPQSFSMGR